MTEENINSNKITNSANKASLRRAAPIAGIGLFIMVIATPFAELFVYPN